MDQKLKYRDERDKTYGITGMAIAMVLADGEDMIMQVSLDEAAGESISFTPDFYFQGNPRLSAKLAWKQMLQQLSLASGMLMGNAMCRSYLIDGSRLSDEAMECIKNFIREEGSECCSLEADEAENIFRRNFSYYDRVFNHHAVASIAHNFAGQLMKRRTMSISEILDNLQDLARL